MQFQSSHFYSQSLIQLFFLCRNSMNQLVLKNGATKWFPRYDTRLFPKLWNFRNFFKSFAPSMSFWNKIVTFYSHSSLLQLTLIWNIGYYTSPLIITFLYRRGYFVAESISSLAKVSTGIGLLVVISLCIRGIGRSKSVIYTKFVKALIEAQSNVNSQSAKDQLRMFDFDFKAWPVDFNVKNVSGYVFSSRLFFVWLNFQILY